MDKWGCPKESWTWFAWDYPGHTSISTTLHGTGKAVLEFGNCLDGKVVAYKNDQEIQSAGKKSDAKVIFDFQDGDELKIQEESESWTSGVIKFKSLDFISCSST